jgi:hypothetical protein
MGQIKCNTEIRERDIQGRASQRNKNAVLHVGLHNDFYGKDLCTNNVCEPLALALHIFYVIPYCMLPIRSYLDSLLEEMRRMT